MRRVVNGHEMGDHPREYGENSEAGTAMRSALGSSPRIRGESSRDGTGPAAAGIIPANTGRMHLPTRRSHSHGDHPREYGENTISPKSNAQRRGSSPRIRGESVIPATISPCAGIIPANTGRIGRTRHLNHPIRDHPREYGENVANYGQDNAAPGSSPRIRGE